MQRTQKENTMAMTVFIIEPTDPEAWESRFTEKQTRTLAMNCLNILVAYTRHHWENAVVVSQLAPNRSSMLNPGELVLQNRIEVYSETGRKDEIIRRLTAFRKLLVTRADEMATSEFNAEIFIARFTSHAEPAIVGIDAGCLSGDIKWK